jgi:hypothetical protein
LVSKQFQTLFFHFLDLSSTRQPSQPSGAIRYFVKAQTFSAPQSHKPWGKNMVIIIQTAVKKQVDESRYGLDESSFRFNQLLYKGLAQELISISKASVLSSQSVNTLKTALNFV